MASTAVLLAIAGCGGGTRQDAGEARADFKVKIVGASFPAAQQLAASQQMNISVRNADSHTIPNVAVTVDGFTNTSRAPGLADPSRPTFIVDNGPYGGESVYKGTWALGTLAPGQTKTFTWHVTAIKPGKFTLHYRVAAGLTGKARAQLDDGSVPQGAFNVNVSGTPAAARVDPNTGRVIRSPAAPPSTGPSAPGSTRGGVQTTGTRSTPPPPGY